VLEQYSRLALARSYIICKLDPDLGHTDEGFVEVLDSTQGILRCLEAYIAYAPSCKEFGIGDIVSSSEVTFEVLVGDCGWKTADENARYSSVHGGVVLRGDARAGWTVMMSKNLI
jgi:hypothetical protein